MDNYLDNCQKNNNIKTWEVKYSRDGIKQIKELSTKIKEAAYSLVRELKIYGPSRLNWRNYGKFKGLNNCFHCHVNSGKPRYVACWKIVDKKEKILEVYYVGTHEKAPY